MADPLTELKTRWQTISDLRHAAAVLHWDQSTYMPPGGAAARGQQLGTLTRLAHEHLVDPKLGGLLDQLERDGGACPPGSADAALVRAARREFDRDVKVPARFVAALSAHTSALYDTWTRARPADDFGAVRAGLERSLDLSRELAGYFSGYDHPADPLIDYADQGMTTAALRTLFGSLRAQLVPLVETVTSQPAPDDTCLKQEFPIDQQRVFGQALIRKFGFDFQHGRQDESPHPFMTSFATGDVRITTRFQLHELSDGLFSTLHEAGHALYERGVNPAYDRSPLAGGVSAGVHESQSRLWENVVGRSRAFWEQAYPELQTVFPDQLGAVTLETFYRAINRVERSLIRTEADELTYNLHVMIRFDLELAMLEGTLAVGDLPHAWRERYRTDLGIVPDNDRDGVLQDVHWFSGTIGGGFQGYTLGNILGSQFFQAACAAHPAIPAEIAGGRFESLHGWLRDNVYTHGCRYTPTELVEQATGHPLDIAPYLGYLETKFGELYTL